MICYPSKKIPSASLRLASKRVWRWRNVLIGLLLLVNFAAEAQEVGQYDWEDFLESITTDEEEAEGDEWMEYVEELKLLHEHPMNINTATREELGRLPMLDDKQIEEIQAYIYLHGAMGTLGELKLLPLLDKETRRVLPLFLYAGEPEKKERERLLGDLRSTLNSRIGVPLYYRQGYCDGTYVGNPLQHRIRFQTGNTHHAGAGLRIEKDAGERFYDYYGGYAELRDVGILGRVVAGDYRAGFGEGLVMGSGTIFSKSNLLGQNGRGIRPMTSMSETDYLRGGALTLRLGGGVELSALISHRKLDATLNDTGEAVTLLRTGYHRTTRERENRHNLGSTLMGGHLGWRTTLRSGRNHEETDLRGTKQELTMGLTMTYTRLTRTLNPGDALYRRYFPRGRQFAVAGVNYGYEAYRWTLAGETAYSWEQGGVASLNRLKWMANRRWTVNLVQRYYDKRYYSFGASALAESRGGFSGGGAGGTAAAGSVQNENGVLIGARGQLASSWNLAGYLDLFYHPWPRYGMTHSSSGQEGMVELDHEVNKHHTLTARYQMKRKESSDRMEPHHRLKLQWQYAPQGTGYAERTDVASWKWKTTGVLHRVLGKTGVALGETVQCNRLFANTRVGDRLRLTALASWFHTDNYASRIYFYLPSLYLSTSSAFFYGHGTHTSICLRWRDNLGKRRRGAEWWMEARFASTCLLDREEQGSGPQLLRSRWKNDVEAQIVLKL